MSKEEEVIHLIEPVECYINNEVLPIESIMKNLERQMTNTL